MTDYTVENWRSQVASADTVLEEMETQIETIDNTKTIRLNQIVHVGADNFIGFLIYDT